MEKEISFGKRENMDTPLEFPTPEEKTKWIEINNLKRRGDFVLVATLVGISENNARQAFRRPASKYHKAVVNALDQVINSRRELLQGAERAWEEEKYV